MLILKICNVLITFIIIASVTVHAWAQGGNWEKEWAKTLTAAKEEGRINIYMYYRSGAVLKVFEKEHPEIRVVSVTGTGSQLTARIRAERRAGKYIPDVFNGGFQSNFNVLYKGKALDSIKSVLMHPEVVDETKWYGGKHRYVDAENKYIFAYLARPRGGQMSYNSNLVKPKEVNSYRDFLNPRWKGKIVSLDPTLTTLGLTYLFPYNHPELGPEFIKRLLTSMDITFSRNIRQTTDWLARGKFALCLGCKDIIAAKKQGLPVDSFDTRGWKEGGGLNTNPGTLSLVNRAPHPNAAKVFINWLLSRKGQIAFQNFGGGAGDPFNSGRVDIPKGGIPPEGRPMKGEIYVDLARPKYADTRPFFSFVREIMRESQNER